MALLMSPAKVLEREQKRAKRESLELAMLQQLKALGLMDGMERQHKFIPGRQYQADFCWPAARLILEVDGGTWVKGGHSSGAGIERDYERDALAVIFGWRVLRATSNQVLDGSAAFWVESILANGMPAAVTSAGQQPGEDHGKTQTRADETRQGTGPRRQARLLTKADLDVPRKAFQKREYVRSPTLREAYRLIPCQHCGRQDGTVACAHSNWAIHGKGKAIKASDDRGASLCTACHVPLLDQGSKLTNEQKQAMWWSAHVKTVKALRKLGHWPKHIAVPDISTYPF